MSKSITFEHGGKKYTLCFTLRTAGQCEQDGFVLEELAEKPATMIPLLFYWSFVQNHRGITKKQTSEIFKEMTHKEDLVVALGEMYSDAVSALIDTDEEEGNANWTVN